MRKRAFTLVEILVVIVIIGIILAFLIPNALRATRVAQAKQCASNIQAINSAIQMCMAETRNAEVCDSFAELADYAPQGVDFTTLVCPITNAVYVLDIAGAVPVVDTADHFAPGDFGGAHVQAGP